MNLIIVESPTKAKTIGQFVGEEYTVTSSNGHIRDLPKSQLGIDVEKNFEPHYVIPRKKQKTVTHLKKAALKASKIILATDEDREGEAIAFHLVQALGLAHRQNPNPKIQIPNVNRIVFHEITKSAIAEALEHPRSINVSLVDAQQARRVLDRLVGYKLSPFLWKKVVRGLSAGRVQSVALRLIADREEEIKGFKAEEYWSIEAVLETRGSTPRLNSGRAGIAPRTKAKLGTGQARINAEFTATLYRVGDKMIPKLGIKNEAEAKKIVHDLEAASFSVLAIQKKELKKNPLPPFTTSTLQQEGTKRLGFSAKKTMFLAQNLYESGHISYMRTDSVNLSKEALGQAAQWIAKNLDKTYHLPSPRQFKTKSRLAQEAHEAIRPTQVETQAKSLKLERDQAKLYDLIWRRFIASQLPVAVFDATHVEILSKNPKNPVPYTLVANGTILRFDGFLKFWPIKFEERALPELKEHEPLTLKEMKPEQHFTEPPPRYNEASLIKTLEKYGIGRPSTYAPIISVIQERNYVEKREGRFYPTEIGTLVNNVLKENFPEIVDIQFTAKMEEELDEIADGKEQWQNVIREFYQPFSKHLEEKYETVKKHEFANETTDQMCEKCGKPMTVKYGRFGKFLACTGFPDCKNTKTLREPPKSTGVTCPKCLETTERKGAPGELVERRVRKGRARGRVFWGCSRYPDCDHATWTNPTGEKKQPSVETETKKNDDDET